MILFKIKHNDASLSDKVFTSEVYANKYMTHAIDRLGGASISPVFQGQANQDRLFKGYSGHYFSKLKESRYIIQDWFGDDFSDDIFDSCLHAIDWLEEQDGIDNEWDIDYKIVGVK